MSQVRGGGGEVLQIRGGGEQVRGGVLQAHDQLLKRLGLKRRRAVPWDDISDNSDMGAAQDESSAEAGAEAEAEAAALRGMGLPLSFGCRARR